MHTSGQSAVFAFAVLGGALFLGKMCRTKAKGCRFFEVIPSCVFGGVGLCGLRQIFRGTDQSAIEDATLREYMSYWRGNAETSGSSTLLISVFFASLYLSMDVRLSDSIHEALPQLCIQQVMCWTEYTVAVLVFALLKQTGVISENVNDVASVAVPIGFEGSIESLGTVMQNRTFTKIDYIDGIYVTQVSAWLGNVSVTLIGLLVLIYYHDQGLITGSERAEEPDEEEEEEEKEEDAILILGNAPGGVDSSTAAAREEGAKVAPAAVSSKPLPSLSGYIGHARSIRFPALGLGGGGGGGGPGGGALRSQEESASNAGSCVSIVATAVFLGLILELGFRSMVTTWRSRRRPGWRGGGAPPARAALPLTQPVRRPACCRPPRPPPRRRSSNRGR